MAVLMSDNRADYFTEPLTPREMDVLRLLAEGHSNKRIAETLYIEHTTVKWYNAQIYGKLAVNNRKEAVIRARTLGILTGPTSNPNENVKHNLPTHTVPFVGRTQDIQHLYEVLASNTTRLVTILGAGGMGKTRLSIEVGRRSLVRFKDGVYFISLVAIASREEMLTTIASSVGYHLIESSPPEDQLIHFLRAREVLLICDNVEHLVNDVAVLTRLLESAPGIKILATSREKLQLAGEIVHRPGGLSNTEGNSDAVRLFTDAAGRIPYPILQDDMPLVKQIVQQLGGMPLGILLAAAWLDSLTLAEIQQELTSGFGLLESKLRDAPQRHRSVEAVFEQSWNRLSASEQVVFFKLSVFRGGFTRHAATAVAVATTRDLQGLVHQSFMQLEHSGRYTIHELMRQVGEQKLRKSMEFVSTRTAHARYFRKLVKTAGDAAWGYSDEHLLKAMHTDFENIRAAWQFEADQLNLDHMREYLDGLLCYATTYGRPYELFDMLNPVVEQLQKDVETSTVVFCAQLEARRVWMLDYVGDYETSLRRTQKALNVLEGSGFIEDRIMLLCHMAHLMAIENDQDASLDLNTRAIELMTGVGRSKWAHWIHIERASTLRFQGHLAGALALIQTVPEGRRRLTTEGHLYYDLGEFDRAQDCYNRASKYFTMNLFDLASVYSGVFGIAVKTGQLELAWTYLRDALQFIDDRTGIWGFMVTLNNAIELLMKEDEPQSAAALMFFIVNHPQTNPGLRSWALEHKPSLEQLLSPNEYQQAWEEGQQWELTDVITELIER